MPILEAPAGLDDENTTERSLSPEFVVVEDVGQSAAQDISINAQISEQRHGVGDIWPGPLSVPRIAPVDRDIPTREEDNHWPTAAVHLLPITLPPPHSAELTLDELLQHRVTEPNNLQNMEVLRLRVISYTVTLSRLSLLLPRLQHLDLSGSVLVSLRDLGYGLLHLTYLNVSNCGLNSFDGTSGLPAVRQLVADNNMIRRVGPLAELSLLQHLSAQNNRIGDLGFLSFLGMCPNLEELQLQGNPVCHLSLYRVTLLRSVPTLLKLDGNAVSLERNNSLSTDSESEFSSLSSERLTLPFTASSLSSEVDDEYNNNAHSSGEEIRPITTPDLVHNSEICISSQTHCPTSSN